MCTTISQQTTASPWIGCCCRCCYWLANSCNYYFFCSSSGLYEYFRYFARCDRNNLRMYEKVHIYCSESNKNAIFCDGNHFGGNGNFIVFSPNSSVATCYGFSTTNIDVETNRLALILPLTAGWTRENVKNEFSLGLRSICDIRLHELSAPRHDLWNIINCLRY